MHLENLIVGQNIARYRRLKELKAADVASRMDMKEATYSKYERGETAITVDFMQKIAEVLELDPIQLMSTNPVC